MKLRLFIFVISVLLFAPYHVFAQSADTDGDGLLNVEEETKYFTDPMNNDTDGDGFLDGDEIKNGFSPRHGGNKKLIEVDSDNDYLNDAWELALGTGLMNPDTDGDKYLDGTEVAAGYDPHNPQPVRLAKLITVDLKSQRLEYFFNNIKLGSLPISSGLSRTPTPKGEFGVLAKRPTVLYAGSDYYYPNTKWNLLFHRGAWGGYYIHGAYWHNDFGKPRSHGCVNVSYENMEPLYWFAQMGTKIVIQ